VGRGTRRASTSVSIAGRKGLKEALEVRRGQIGDAGDFVGRLTVELVVDLRLRAHVWTIAERSQVTAPEGPGAVPVRCTPRWTRVPMRRAASVTMPRA
jgi:hypothetical protein